MKKIFIVFAMLAGLSASVSAIGFSVGGRGFAGTNLDKTIVAGGGAFFNLDLIGGFGLQAEANITSSVVTFGEKSVTFTDYSVLDMPILVWYNAKLPIITIGGGVGLNFSSVLGNGYVTKSDIKNMNAGLAAGVNVILNINSHFGLVFGANGVFDFTPTIQKFVSKDGHVTKIELSSDSFSFKRKSIYCSAGLQYKF